MLGEKFLHRALGRWSSHPHWVRWRRRWMVAVLGGASTLLLGFSVYALARPGVAAWALRGFSRHASLWAIAISCVMGALLSLGLTACWSQLQRAGRLVSGGRGTRDRWVWVLVGVSLLVGLGGPLAAIVYRERLATELRVVLQALALVPFLCVVAALSALRAQTDDAEERTRVPLVGLLFGIATALAGLTVVHDLAATWQDNTWRALIAKWIPWYARLERPFLGLLLLLPLAFLLGALWRVWLVAAPDAHDDAGKGLLARIWAWLKRLFTFGGSTTETNDPRPSWLGDVLGDAFGPDDVTRRQEIGDAERDSAAQGLRALFGGEAPTTAQSRALHRFERAWTRAHDDDTFRTRVSSDILLEGELGAGRTATALAAASTAVVGRGQDVLWVVADERAESRTKRLFDTTLEAAGLHPYVTAASLDESVWRAICEGGREGQLLPNIHLVTLPEAEHWLYGGAMLTHEERHHRGQFLRGLQVVVVDDLDAFDEAERSHLAVFLDKHRLLLASSGITPQVLVTTAPLSDLGRDIVCGRLFDEIEFHQVDNAFTLAPRGPLRWWELSLSGDEAGATADGLVARALEQGLGVAIFRDRADEDLRRREGARLSAHAREGGFVRILSDPRDLPRDEAQRVDLIVAPRAGALDARIARRFMGHEQTLLVRVPSYTYVPSTRTGTVPLIAARGSVGLMGAHLRSLFVYLPTGMPLRESFWQRLGLSADRLDATHEGQHVEARLLHDGPNGDARYSERTWPWIEGLRLPEILRRVDVRHLEAPGQVLAAGAAPGEIVMPPQSEVDREAGRLATWHASDGRSLGRVQDLAYLHDLALRRGQRSFRAQGGPRTIDGELQLTAMSARGDGADPVWPVRRLSCVIESPQVTLLGGGPDHGLQWLRVERAEGAWTAEVVLTGLFDGRGLLTEITDHRFTYAADVAALLLRPKDRGHDPEEAALRAGLTGTWSTTTPSFSPEWSLAFAHALGARMPGFLRLAQVLAFVPDSDALADVLLLLIEPRGSGRTASQTLDRVLLDPTERRALLDAARRLLEDAQKASQPRNRARRLALVEYDPSGGWEVGRIATGLR